MPPYAGIEHIDTGLFETLRESGVCDTRQAAFDQIDGGWPLNPAGGGTHCFYRIAAWRMWYRSRRQDCRYASSVAERMLKYAEQPAWA